MRRSEPFIAICAACFMADVTAQVNESTYSTLDLWGAAAYDSSVARVLDVPDWTLPVASLLVPGSGQLLDGKDRGALYLAAEVFLLLRYVSLRAEGHRERERFRTLAFEVARAAFRPSRRDTVFEYFEVMELYVESGPYSSGQGTDLVPPSDESTFNGHIWRLARETFFANPDDPPATESEDYQRALDFYRRRAIGPNFQWSWRNAGLEQDLFRQSISRSDDAFRSATQYLGLVFANHLIGAIDAFVAQRLGGQARLSPTVMLDSDRYRGMTTTMAFRVAF